MSWLRRVLWALAILVFVTGVAATLVLGTPMEVVLPLRAIALVSAAVVLVLIGAAWWMGSDRGWLPVSVLAFDLALAAVVIFVTIRAPSCDDFVVPNEGVRLAGAVCLPSGDRPAPTAILVHGSGPETRSEYRFYAESLAQAGVAAVIYDKRGAGESTGDTYADGYEVYADDLAAIAGWAADQPFSREGATGFVGFSEAEWVMPMAAGAFPPAFIVVVGPSGLSPHEQVSEEIAIRLERAGYDGAARQAAIEVNEALARYLRGDLEGGAFGSVLEAAQRQPWFRIAADLPDQVYPREAYAWWSGVMDTDPAIWQGYDGPVLFIKGGADDRSDAREAARRLAGVLPDPARQLEVRIVEDADHMILLWPRGDRNPPPAFPDGYPGLIAEWIFSVTAR